MCVQEEDVNLGVLPHSHYIKLGGSESCTSRNLLIINQVTAVLVHMYNMSQAL